MRIIRGIWSNQRLVSPGKRVRPTHEDVRDAWLSYLEPFLSGARVLDLFAGSGSLGLEALSRGAAAADFVDNSPEALHALKANVAARKLKPLRKGQSPSKTAKSTRIFKRDAIPFSQSSLRRPTTSFSRTRPMVHENSTESSIPGSRTVSPIFSVSNMRQNMGYLPDNIASLSTHPM